MLVEVKGMVLSLSSQIIVNIFFSKDLHSEIFDYLNHEKYSYDSYLQELFFTQFDIFTCFLSLLLVPLCSSFVKKKSLYCQNHKTERLFNAQLYCVVVYFRLVCVSACLLNPWFPKSCNILFWKKKLF